MMALPVEAEAVGIGRESRLGPAGPRCLTSNPKGQEAREAARFLVPLPPTPVGGRRSASASTGRVIPEGKVPEDGGGPEAADCIARR